MVETLFFDIPTGLLDRFINVKSTGWKLHAGACASAMNAGNALNSCELTCTTLVFFHCSRSVELGQYCASASWSAIKDAMSAPECEPPTTRIVRFSPVDGKLDCSMSLKFRY